MMNFNMVTSELELLGNSITNIELNNHIIDFNQDMEKSFGFDVKDVQIDRHNNRAVGRIQLNIRIEVIDNGEARFELDMNIEGAFSTDADTDEDKFMRLLYIANTSVPRW